MRRLLVLLALISFAACGAPDVRSLGSGDDPSATPTDSVDATPTATPVATLPPCSGPRASMVIWSTQLWQLLGEHLQDAADPCTDYYVSIPPVACEPGSTLKLCPRGPAAPKAIRDLGPNFHAMAEFHWASWSQWVQQSGMSFTDAGRKFRQEMDDAGYDVASGDTWEINEFPSTVRTGVGPARANAKLAVAALDEGPAGSLPTKGATFTIDFGHRGTNLGVYKANLESWLEDDAFWQSMGAHVRFFGQEVYPEPSLVCVGSANVGSRSHSTNEFVEHVATLAGAGAAATKTARMYLAKAYLPLMGAAWNQPESSGYGATQISIDEMNKFVSLQVYAARAWSSTHDVPGRRIGFAWAPTNSTGLANAEYQADLAMIADRLGASVRDAYDPDKGNAAHACSANGDVSGCACTLPGAAFNDAWTTFETF